MGVGDYTAGFLDFLDQTKRRFIALTDPRTSDIAKRDYSSEKEVILVNNGIYVPFFANKTGIFPKNQYSCRVKGLFLG